ncbi:hypothetical protein ACH4NT_36755 [Streptomyces lydicus]|uniref:hypothetical protein n=1 Tax=Streptomyces lydicus TaxID=47763 RepID=UPI0037A2DEE8
MSTTNGQPEDPQSQGAPVEPHARDHSSGEHPHGQDALAWTALGLTGALCTTGAILVHTGHSEAGIDLIRVGIAVAGLRTRK